MRELVKGKDREFKSYGIIRIFFYALIFFLSAIFWMLLVLGFFLRLIPFLRIFTLVDILLVFLLGGASAFWVVNFFFLIPTATIIKPGGFKVSAPFLRGGDLTIPFTDLGTILEVGFGTWVTVHSTKFHGKYNIIFGKDTDGYYRLVDTLKDGLNEFRTPT